MKILVINGPNLNFLGIREPDIYGKNTFADLLRLLSAWAEELGVEVEQYQSNHEGDLVDKIQQAYGKFDGIVINPAAYTHTSVAILDALKAVAIPTVEVDGVFGPATQRAVLALQRQQGIDQSGAVGPVLWTRVAELASGL